MVVVLFIYAPILKGPMGASSNWIVLSACL